MSGHDSMTSRVTCQEGRHESRKRRAEGFLIPMPKALYGQQKRLAVSSDVDGLVESPAARLFPSFWSTRMGRLSSVIL